MTIPTLPEGSRLALLNWPMGTPCWTVITAAAGKDRANRARSFRHVVQPLIDASLVEELPREPGQYRAFRLTQAGRKAVDVLQSGVE